MSRKSLPHQVTLTLGLLLIAATVPGPTRAEEGDPKIPVPTIEQARAILSRDLMWVECRDALLAKDWPTLIKLGRKARQFEKVAFGDSFEGNNLTHFMLLTAYSNSGQHDEASKLWRLVYDAGNGEGTKIVDGTEPGTHEVAVEARRRIADLTYTQARFSNGQDISERFEQIIESYDWFAKELAAEAKRDKSGIIRMPPVLSMLRSYVFMQHGDFDRAVELARSAMQQLKRENPDNWWLSVDEGGGEFVASFVASALVTRSQFVEQNGQWDEALELLEEAEPIAKRLLKKPGGLLRGLNHLRAIVQFSEEEKAEYKKLESQRARSVVLASQRKFKDATTIATDILPSWIRLFGNDAETTAMIHRRLGYWLWTQESYRKAIDHLITAVDQFSQNRSADDTVLSTAAGDVFINLSALGSSDRITDSVIEPVEQFIERLRLRFGDENPLVLDGEIALAGYRRRLGFSKKQREALVTVAAIKRQGDQAYSNGNYRGALGLRQKFLKQSEALLGTDDAMVHDAQFLTANLMVELGRHVEAETLYQELFRRTDRKPYSLTAEHAARLQWRATNMSALFKTDQALALITRAKECCLKTTGDQSERYAHCLRIESRIFKDDLRKPADAYPLLIEVIDTLKFVYNGENGFEVCQAMVDLADCERQLGYYDKSEEHLKTALEIRRRNGFNNWSQTCWNHFQRGLNAFEALRFADAVESFEAALKLKKRYDPGGYDVPNVYGYLISSSTWTDELDHKRWVDEFLSHAKQQYKEGTPEYARSLISVLTPLTVPAQGTSMGGLNADRANVIVRFCNEALAILQNEQAKESWLPVIARQYLAEAHLFNQEFTPAVDRLTQAIKLAEQIAGRNSLLFARVSASLAKAYRHRGDLAQSLRHGDLSLQGFQKIRGDDSPAVSELSLRHADLLSAMGDFDRAEALVVKAENIMSRAGVGRRSQAILQLAELYLRMGQIDRAELWLHRGRLIAADEVVGTEVETRILLLLTRLHLARREFDAALPIAKELLRRCQQNSQNSELLVGAHHLLGQTLLAKGDNATAEKHLLQSIELAGNSVNVQSLEWGTHATLAQLYLKQNRVSDAESSLAEGVSKALSNEHQLASVLSENQQLALRLATDRAMHGYLTFALDQDLNAEKVHAFVTQWKGAVFMQQARQRLASRSSNPKTVGISKELEKINRELASQVFAQRNANDQATRVDRLKQLTTQKQRLESELATLIGKEDFVEPKVGASVGWGKTLNSKEVLLDFVEFSKFETIGDLTSTQSKHFIVFVIQGGAGTVDLVDLGPAAPINQSITKWRDSFTPGPGFSETVGADAAGERLASLIWAPLKKLVGKAKTVMVSPDGRLTQVPFAAMPGSQKNGRSSMLAYAHAFVTVPVPRWLVESRSNAKNKADPNVEKAPKILLMGDVDYSSRVEPKLDLAEPAGTANSIVGKDSQHTQRWASRSRLRSTHWDFLPGTRDEVAEIALVAGRCFSTGKVVSLHRREACEDSIRQHASGTRFLHLATHGFFAGRMPKGGDSKRSDAGQSSLGSMPVTDNQTVPGLHPSFLSGVVLAGANQPPVTGQDDGLLTAAEVTELDLRATELVVLSACETGLGEVQSGEGVVGLQRAFAIAGAQSVLTSLWKVDDRATQVFMNTFYERLWSDGMTKAAALQAAQLEMIERYQPHSGALRGDRPLISDENELVDLPVKEKDQSLSPFYWAAFTLSGSSQ